ncbi:MAG: L,D-transpeptidase family protein [Verrucomicrobiaceae bacterium]|nr:L,D-transpeptidase family protein [Verrucomicrobiaceae bacterium]
MNNRFQSYKWAICIGVIILCPILSFSQTKEDQLPTIAPDREIAINEQQGKATSSAEIYAKLTPKNISIRISLADQRARMMAGNEVAIDTPISTGKKGHETPTGEFSISEKLRSHRSSLYGEFVSKGGDVVKSGATPNSKHPRGSTFRGAAMPYSERLTERGVGMHVGKLPGEAASHGCLRFPVGVMPLIYARTKVGTKVTIVE